jgi:hypothetical protein
MNQKNQKHLPIKEGMKDGNRWIFCKDFPGNQLLVISMKEVQTF